MRKQENERMKTNWKKRGIDYPAYTEDGIKMQLVMSEDEVKEWFNDEDLKEYPCPNAYHGSLP